MVLNKKAMVAALLSGLVLTNGCALKSMVKMAKDQQLTVVPSPLEVHGDSVAFEMSAVLPLKMLKKNKVYNIDTRYQYGDMKVDLETLEFLSSDFPTAKTEQPKKAKRYAFAYKETIGNGDLLVVGTASNLAKSKSKSTLDMPVAKGLITTSRLVKNYYFVAYADHGYNNKEELVPTSVQFFFEQGKSDLKKSETKGQNGQFLEVFISQKNKTKTITIVGHHSPEGSETSHTNLADDRSDVIEKYTRKRLEHHGYKTDSIQFVNKETVMDYAELNKELDSTDALTAEQKTEVKNIVNGSGDYLSKQAQIEKLSYYNTILTKVYPQLRTAKTEILTVKNKKSDAELSLLSKSVATGAASIDTLNAEELAYAATLTPILSEKEEIYVALVKKSDSWVAHNNLGAVYLEMAKREADDAKQAKLVEKAVVSLNMSLKKQSSGEAHVNLASAALLKGDRAAARTEALNAINDSLSNDNVKKGANGIQGVLDIKDGKYDMAIQNLSKYQAMKANDAFGFYLAAVTAARQGDEAGVTSNVKQAVALNRSLAEKALNDLEFANFANSENFKNAIK
jgi:hypothetical protein